MSGKYNGILTGTEFAALEAKHKMTEAKEVARQAKLQAEAAAKEEKAKVRALERQQKQEQVLADKVAKASQKAEEKQAKAEQKASELEAANVIKEQARQDKAAERLVAKALADEYSHLPIPDLTVVLADGQSVFHAIKLSDKTTDEREGFWSAAEGKIAYDGVTASPHVFLTSHSLDMIKEGKITRSTPHMDIWNTKGHGLYVKLGSVQKPIRLLQPSFISSVPEHHPTHPTHPTHLTHRTHSTDDDSALENQSSTDIDQLVVALENPPSFDNVEYDLLAIAPHQKIF